MAMTNAERVKACRERKRSEAALAKGIETVTVHGSYRDMPEGFEARSAAAANVVPADRLLKLVDELYMAGLFRGSEARIRLRALVKDA